MGCKETITLVSGRPPAKVSQSQTAGCCPHERRPFLLALRPLTALSENIPTRSFAPYHLFYVFSNHLFSPQPKKNYPHYSVYPLLSFFSLNVITFFTFTWFYNFFIFLLCLIFFKRGAALFAIPLQFSIKIDLTGQRQDRKHRTKQQVSRKFQIGTKSCSSARFVHQNKPWKWPPSRQECWERFN